MSNNAEVVFTGTASQLLAEYNKLNAKNQQLEGDLKKVGAASKAAAAEAKALGKDAAKAFEDTRTPLEKYNTRMARYRELLQKGKIDQDTFNRALAKQNELLQSAERGTQAVTVGFGKATDFATAFKTSIAGIGSVMGATTAIATQLKRELEDLERIRNEARNAQQTYGVALRETLTNFAPDQGMSEKDVDPELRRIAKATGADQGAVARVASAAFSAQGGLSNKETASAVEEAFRLLPGNEEAARSLAQGAMDMANQSGTKDFKSILGFISQGKQATGITGDKQFGDAFIPAVNATTTRGGTAEQAAEVFATLGDLMGDKMGDRTRTAQIGLNEQLAEALPNVKGGISGRIAYMQQHPEERAAFLKKSHFEMAATPFIEKFLSGDPNANAIWKVKQAKIGAINAPGNAAAWEQRVSNLNGAPFQGMIAAGKAGAGNIEQFRLGEEDAGIAATASGIRKDTMDAIDTKGMNWFNRETAEWTERAGGGGPAASARALGFGRKAGEFIQEHAAEAIARPLAGPIGGFISELIPLFERLIDPDAKQRAQRQEVLMKEQLKVLQTLARPKTGGSGPPEKQLGRSD